MMRHNVQLLRILVLTGLVSLAGCASFVPQSSKLMAPLSGRKGSQISYARLCERQDQTEQAEQIYRQMLKQDPKLPDAHHRLAVVLAKQGRFEESQQHFQAAMAYGPTKIELQNDLGYSLYLQDRLGEAEQVLRKSLAQDPRNATALNNLGLVLGQQGRTEETFGLFRQAGSEAEAYSNMAYVHALQNNFDSAAQDYSRALTINPQLRSAADGAVQMVQQQARREQLVAQTIAQQRVNPQTALPPAAPAEAIASRQAPPAAPAIPPAARAQAVHQEMGIAEVLPGRKLPSGEPSPQHDTASHQAQKREPAIERRGPDPRAGDPSDAPPQFVPVSEADQIAEHQQPSVPSAAPAVESRASLASAAEAPTVEQAPLKPAPIVPAAPVVPSKQRPEAPLVLQAAPSDSEFMAIASSDSPNIEPPASNGAQPANSYPVTSSEPARLAPPRASAIAATRETVKAPSAGTDMFGDLSAAVTGQAAPRIEVTPTSGPDVGDAIGPVQAAAANMPADVEDRYAVERAFAEVVPGNQPPVTAATMPAASAPAKLAPASSTPNRRSPMGKLFGPSKAQRPVISAGSSSAPQLLPGDAEVIATDNLR